MVHLYGLDITREQLLARVGDVAQVGGVHLSELSEGPGRGERVADFRTGSGLCFTVLIDRGLDIGALEFCGEPLAWRRGEAGGALVSAGPFCDGAVEAAYMPAQGVLADGFWQGNHYEMFIEGRLTSVGSGGERLELQRRIWARLGESHFHLRDRVSNSGGVPAPHSIAYRCHLGFPLLDDEAELLAPTLQVLPRDEAARAGLEGYNRFERPQAGYVAQVFDHEMVADGAGMVTVALANHRTSVGRGLGLYLRYRRRELPRLGQVKMMGYGDYFVALAPANCLPGGTALTVLEPGETREYLLEMGVLPDNGAIERLEEDLQQSHPEWAQRRM